MLFADNIASRPGETRVMDTVIERAQRSDEAVDVQCRSEERC